MTGEIPEQRITLGNGGGLKSKEVTLLESDEYQSSKYLGDLSDLLGVSNDEDRLQARMERIRIHKYLGEKLLPPY